MTKSEFAFIALPISALVAPSTFAVQYLTVDQAQRAGNGSLFLGTFGILTVTGYGLYYAGGESLRAWTSWIHLAVGLGLPLLLILHIWLGKRTRPAAQVQKRPSSVAKLT